MNLVTITMCRNTKERKSKSRECTHTVIYSSTVSKSDQGLKARRGRQKRHAAKILKFNQHRFHLYRNLPVGCRVLLTTFSSNLMEQLQQERLAYKNDMTEAGFEPLPSA